jgi:hypothetical protein
MHAALAKAFGDTPPILDLPTWDDCLGKTADQFLLLEAELNSPASSRAMIRERYTRSLAHSHPVHYVRDAAAEGGTSFEGSIRADALFGNGRNGFRVLFESKLLSDISCEVRFDPCRNQLARNIDVLLEPGGPLLGEHHTRRLLCLLTPGLFFDDKATRYYGLLYEAYKQQNGLLASHLPHRNHEEVDLARHRLGGLTFEQCAEIEPAACPWLQPRTSWFRDVDREPADRPESTRLRPGPLTTGPACDPCFVIKGDLAHATV